MIVERNVSDSQRAEARRGKAQTWKNWQRRRKNKHLDADVEVSAHKAWRAEDVVGDVAAEQMNSFVQSKIEVFEKIEESLRPLCMVEDLNDDEITELRTLSNELNACEATAILNPSKFASCATKLGLGEGVCSGFDNCKSQQNNVGPHPKVGLWVFRSSGLQVFRSCLLKVERRVFRCSGFWV